ncbi:MAG: hypothetical protein B5M54_10035 [Candidatus Aminicenantes bacterium 4484_214]|nr:MAG: hypothetical protein B5M54_10035 [Candidatus Aminicenantes bacterium 4484_214]
MNLKAKREQRENKDNIQQLSLVRKLSLFPTTNIVIANMIGAGIFTTSGLLIKDLGHPLVMLALWAVGGIIALCGALSYGILASAMPEAGGEYIFLSKLFHPLFGFLSGWVSFFVGFSAPIAASAIGVSEYLIRAFPGIVGGETTPGLLIVFKKLLAILIVALFTGIHLRGIELGAKVQNLLTIVKVSLIVGLIILGFSLGEGQISNLFTFSQFKFDLSGWKTIGLCLMWIMFAYSGWNAAAYIGSEVKKPEKNLPYSLLLGTGVVIFLYLGLNLLFIYAIPLQEMKGVISVGGLAGGKLFGPVAGRVISIIIAFALFSSLSAFIILGPRVYYAMARDGYFLRWAAFVHPTFRVPTKSILIQGLIAIIFITWGTFEQILTYMGFSLGIFPLLAVAGVFKLYHQQGLRRKIKMIGFPIVPLLYIFAGVLILILGFLERPIPSTVAILTVLAGLPIYFLFARDTCR